MSVAEALAYAHRQPLRVIHRGIKPSNVLIRSSDNSVKVTDFGIAAVLGERSGRTVIGSADYMPPEQAKREGVDERSDLYSLGVMLYQMLTGRLPPLFASAPAQPPSNWLGSMPREMSTRIDRLVLGLLAAGRNQRHPQIAAALVEELRVLLEARPARPQSGPQIDPAIANAPTRRSSAPFLPTERAAAPPVTKDQLSGTLPASLSKPATLYPPSSGYQVMPKAPTGQKRRISRKAIWALITAILAPLMFVAPFLVFGLGSNFVTFPGLAGLDLKIVSLLEVAFAAIVGIIPVALACHLPNSKDAD